MFCLLFLLWLPVLHVIFVSLGKVLEIKYWSPLNCEWETENFPPLLTSGLSLVSLISPSLLLGFFLSFEVWVDHYRMSFPHEVHRCLSSSFFPGSSSHFLDPLGFYTVLQVLPPPIQSPALNLNKAHSHGLHMKKKLEKHS